MEIALKIAELELKRVMKPGWRAVGMLKDTCVRPHLHRSVFRVVVARPRQLHTKQTTPVVEKTEQVNEPAALRFLKKH